MDVVTTFTNRLRKNQKRLVRGLPPGTDCYRLYDRDIPELPVVVEVFGDRARLQEMPGRLSRTDDEHLAFLASLHVATAEVLQVGEDAVHLSRRERRRKGEQHQRRARSDERHIVHERGLAFGVNLTDYIDTGLFLDHRPTRGAVHKLAGGKAVLNLFAYTCSFTVMAAAGGAARTVSVDLSQAYLDWGEDNLALNALEGDHTFICADALAWLRSARDRFDLIVLDPPTLSKSKRMQGDLDVQRDHVAMISDALGLLAPGGTLWFSTNLTTFALDDRAFAGASAREITDKSVPPDFRHQPHRCWRATVG
jgi:23S rRNA G2069 N7-methylase RlmK/C1962 C5-methylase RlmI